MAAASLILASGSERRRELVGQLGVPFRVIPATVPEPEWRAPQTTARQWASALAYFKASSVAAAHPDCWVLGADTVAAIGGEILGKPKDVDDARRMLMLQAGAQSEVITGVSLLRFGEPRVRLIRAASTHVWMRRDIAAIEQYLATDDWRDKAGAYGIQSVGDALVERIEGSFTNVVGLPLELTRRMLVEVGLLQAADCDSAAV